MLSGDSSSSTAGKAPQTGKGGNVHTLLRERKNWLINMLYLRQEFEECKELIEEQLQECQGMCEFAIYVKALIYRQEGKIQESLAFFQAVTCLNPHNVLNLKQVGRSLYLLGNHKAAIDVYDEALILSPDDWEIFHNKGLCYMYLRQYDEAVDSFEKANDVQRHDVTFLQLGKVFVLREEYKKAIELYTEALEFSPENPEILTTLGILYLRMGESLTAFDHLGNSLTHNPRNPKTILAAGSIIQDHADMDVALVKYLDPFEWIISYNLGLVHLNTGQYASAFHYFSSSINLKPDFPSSCAAYEKACEMETQDPIFQLNFAITLFNHGDLAEAKKQFLMMKENLNEEEAEGEILEMKATLEQLLV
eukprot:g7583.t1